MLKTNLEGEISTKIESLSDEIFFSDVVFDFEIAD